MSGHSKWANIKHKKAKGDAAKANVFTKIGREIAVAVKAGGPDPATNSKLADMIVKARKNNMPNDNIQKGIKKASGELGNINYEELVYEGYGVNGVAIIVETLTDNKNRTGGDVRYVFDKSGGQMGTTGCVSFMFDRKGVILVMKEGNPDFDTMMDYCLEAGADDNSDDEDSYEIMCDMSAFGEVRKFLTDKGIVIDTAEMEWIPQNTVELPEERIDQ
ncbi:MAG: YebC/PmpR family DNA-binding transcriptional regulator, partial [Clostridia bacterium]